MPTVRSSSRVSPALPLAAGMGFHPSHAPEVLEGDPALGFLEVHAENYMSDGGPSLRMLDALAERYPISIHGVGLSIGGLDDLDAEHLSRLRRLIDRARPASFSEHLAWSSHDGVYFNDLLPIRYDEAALDRVSRHVDQAQHALGRRLLLENPSTYVPPSQGGDHEVAFLAEVSSRTGCGLLLDVNNVVVSCTNHGWDETDYLLRFPLGHVGEIHLAGHEATKDRLGQPLLIDTHDRAVAEKVWRLFEFVVERAGPRATLIERDHDIPSFEERMAEVRRASEILGAARRTAP